MQSSSFIPQTTVFDSNSSTSYAIVFALEQGVKPAGSDTTTNLIVCFSIPADQPYDAGVMLDYAWVIFEN